MAVLCKDLNFVFIENPCAASSAIGDFLKEHYDGIDLGTGHNTLAETGLSGYQSAAVIRNPFDKLVSQHTKHNYYDNGPLYDDLIYIWCCENKPTFEEYLEATFGKFANVVDWAYYFPRRGKDFGDWRWVDPVDHLLLFEDLQNSVDHLLMKFNVCNQHKVELKNQTRGKQNYKDAHTSRTRKLVEIHYGKYLCMYGYCFEGNVRTIVF